MVTECVKGCKCERFTQDESMISSTYISPDRCECGHTKINHKVTKR